MLILLIYSRYVSTLEKMGFHEMYAVAALRQTDNDINASMDIIQEHPGEKTHVHKHCNNT